ncbi:hypothetical protein [Bacteroides sp.]|uniref:hypothetical protein n=1 Tax=Bacteroides sp. TaxID=29523 RepID=UPI002616C83B|nr:hypothetical protein [Bacteroides sp.]MDD3040432.1 hypothetical protein [Bacteroides sp.]
MAEIAEMREVVTKKYSSNTEKGKAWPKKVHKMKDSQVTAIYLRIQAEERRKNQRREREQYSIYVG